MTLSTMETTIRSFCIVALHFAISSALWEFFAYVGIHVLCPIFLYDFDPLNSELNLTCHLLALLGAHRILHVSG